MSIKAFVMSAIIYRPSDHVTIIIIIIVVLNLANGLFQQHHFYTALELQMSL